ncbi:4Fe-4S single cluster domain-containing protein [Amycolatopsis sp. cmx-4-68]|uniref:4Fe-4S single cluster domain-containing protein n=1 Tax=Amycolatopsis sp. cmx-4-68 TaxID=2790938 RepID=UPI00397DAC00
MIIQLSRLQYPVTVLGYGRRVGIWFQGCSIGCAGCMSQDTWPAEAGTSVEVADVLAWIEDRADNGIDGVTISGGEPFEQPTGLDHLLEQLDCWRAARQTPVDLLCYSGRALHRLQAEHQYILERLDAIVPEPFLQQRPSELPLRGSANQSIICLTSLGTERYAAMNTQNADRRQSRLQVTVDGDTIWYIGIPGRGDLERLSEKLKDYGIVQEQVSWRS